MFVAPTTTRPAATTASMLHGSTATSSSSSSSLSAAATAVSSMASAVSATSSAPDAVPASTTGQPSLSAARMPRRWSCETCRAKKVKCDGVRPICGNCARRTSRRCVFLGLLARVDTALAQRNQREIARARQQGPGRRAVAAPTPARAAPPLPAGAGGGFVTATAIQQSISTSRRGWLDSDLGGDPIPEMRHLNVFEAVSSGRLGMGLGFGDHVDEPVEEELRRPAAPFDEERRLAEAYFDDHCGPFSIIHRRSYLSGMHHLPAFLRYVFFFSLI
ncbi:hypothetical protein HK405_011491 [Cladochytrium tenue]|nr:hypothetical protein HK405_011491 [Cladochytrium tenue]